ncbi:hypothetical protein FRC10_010480 [Ceratobasidium sp. 414]|nr:hypothetical protein FRC10_010480 [Ceratobasidium sp. 414]
MASFAVQAIQNVIKRTSTKRMNKRRAAAGDPTSPEYSTNGNSKTNNHASDAERNGHEQAMSEEIDEMHSTLVLRCHASYAGSEVGMHEEYLKDLLEHAVALERTARKLLVAHLEEGSRAHVLLRADWNLQARDLRLLESGDTAELRGGVCSDVTGNEEGVAGISGKGTGGDREEREEAEITNTAVEGMDEEETMCAVRDFRKNVAGMLALGSRMRKLGGAEKYVFERRREGEIGVHATKGEKPRI